VAVVARDRRNMLSKPDLMPAACLTCDIKIAELGQCAVYWYGLRFTD